MGLTITGDAFNLLRGPEVSLRVFDGEDLLAEQMLIQIWRTMRQWQDKHGRNGLTRIFWNERETSGNIQSLTHFLTYFTSAANSPWPRMVLSVYRACWPCWLMDNEET